MLVVCTGNICRSPAAELLLLHGVSGDITVSSAGLRAVVGSSVCEPIASMLGACGVDSLNFRARQVTEEMIRRSDLVLAMTRAQRAALVDMSPGAVRRSFTLREFARLLSRVDERDLPQTGTADRFRAAIPLTASQRYMHGLSPDVDDITDPYGGPIDGYSSAFDLMQVAVRTIAARTVQPHG